MKKVFSLFFVSLCLVVLVVIGLVLSAGSAHAQPPNCSPVAHNLAMCQGNLDVCEDDLAACEEQPLAPGAQTGQTTMYAAGDDGDIQAGVVPPTPRFTDNLDGTITDNLTGIVWLKDANCFAALNWANALTAANTLDGDDVGPVECGLSDGSVEGDWYLANRIQLMSLLDLENSDLALPTGHPFMNFQSGYYWSSTTLAADSLRAWGVSFNDGISGNLIKATNHLSVLPVRGGQ